MRLHRRAVGIARTRLLLLCATLAVAGAIRVRARPAGHRDPAPPYHTVARPDARGAERGAAMLAYLYQGDIWVRQLPGGRPCRLTADGCNAHPRWSPSGEWIAFLKVPGRRSDAGEQLWVMARDGSQARQLAENADSAWSPRRDTLASARGEDLCLAEPPDWRGRALPRSTGLVRASLEGPAWSPDGRWLAFLAEIRRGETDPSDFPDYSRAIWRCRADGSQARQLSCSHGDENAPTDLRWSPDGRRILFWALICGRASSVNADGVPLYDVPVNGGRPRLLSRGGSEKAGDNCVLRREDFLSFSPDGASLLISRGNGRFEGENKWIARLDYAAGRSRRLTDRQHAAFSTTWSPDGARIAYVSLPTDPAREVSAGYSLTRLWVMAADGSGKRQLTADPRYADSLPVWMERGNAIFFTRTDLAADRQDSLWTIRPDGTGLRELAPLSAWDGSYPWDRGLFDLWEAR
jgi:Tol biopolymer transport system component